MPPEIRAKIGYIVPSTNTTAQTEIDDLRPSGVTNHIARMTIRNSLMVEQPGFDQVLEDMRASVAPSILSLCTADPDIVTIGVSPEAFWTGPENQAKLITEFEQEAGGRPVVTCADAITAALEQLGSLSRVGVITPYLQLGDDTVRRFFDDRGFEVIAIEGMGGRNPCVHRRNRTGRAPRNR